VAVAYRILRWAVGNVGPTGAADWPHIHGLLRWALHGQSGSRFVLGRNLEARREFSHLILERTGGNPAREAAVAAGYQYSVPVPGTVKIKEAGLALRFELVPPGVQGSGYNGSGDILLDGRIAGSPLLLRSWRAGDAYRPAGYRATTKVQDLFQRRRIPLRERKSWPVLVWDGTIVWVRGFAVADGLSGNPERSACVAIRELGGE
jgi:tRNA(Ile)-lysidine synthase